ncbi:hypothetical protein AVEN_84266-1, partial [Araneus ventricosus]
MDKTKPAMEPIHSPPATESCHKPPTMDETKPSKKALTLHDDACQIEYKPTSPPDLHDEKPALDPEPPKYRRSLPCNHRMYT